MSNKITYGPYFPCHVNFHTGNSCCGIFNVITEDSQVCNECGEDINVALNKEWQEIKVLQSQLESVREAAKPFIKFSKTYDSSYNDRIEVASYSENGNVIKITLGDLRKLVSAMEE